MKYLKNSKIILLAILAGGAIIRLMHYTKIALWHDEAFSALLIRMPFSEMMHRIGLDVHPPFYYWLLDIWSWIFGHGLASLRGFSVFFGLATVIAGYFLVKEIFKKEGYALASAALLAFNPFLLQYSLEARMYTLGTFLILASSWLLVKALHTDKWKYWVPFALLTAASMLNHYFMLFSVAAQGLFVLGWVVKNKLQTSSFPSWRWFYSYIIAGILYIPWLPVFWRQFSQVQESYWIPKMTFWSIPQTIFKVFIGGWQGASNHVAAIISLLVAGIFVLYIIRFGKKYINWLLVFGSVIPFLLAILASLQTSVFLDRYFIFAAGFIVAVTACALWFPEHKKFSIGIMSVLIIANLASYAYGWAQLKVHEKPGMGAAAEYIKENASEDDEIIISSTFIYFSHRYYHQPANANLIKPVPKLYLGDITEVSQLPHFSGTALLENKDFTGPLSEYVEPGETVWLVWTSGFGAGAGGKPQVPENWVQQNQKVFPDVFHHRAEIYVAEYVVN